MRAILTFSALVAVITGVAVGCGGDDDHDGSGSGATCPTTQTLTYEGFGKPFMEKYCTRCHSTTKKGDARLGAPADHDFDDVLTIRALAEHIDEHAAAGPAATNKEMPPSAPVPTMEERLQLGEWLACGAP